MRLKAVDRKWAEVTGKKTGKGVESSINPNKVDF